MGGGACPALKTNIFTFGLKRSADQMKPSLPTSLKTSEPRLGLRCNCSCVRRSQLNKKISKSLRPSGPSRRKSYTVEITKSRLRQPSL